MLWLDLPNVRRAIAPRRRTAVLNDVASWMNAALDAKVAAYLTGVRGRHWLEAPIAGLASTKQYHEADFALCRFDISTGEDPGMKSSLQVHVMATVPVKAMKCNCGEGVLHEHGSDKMKGIGRRRVRANALQQVQQQVLKRLLGSELTDCFPVEAQAAGEFLGDGFRTTIECEEQSKPELTQAGGPTTTQPYTEDPSTTYESSTGKTTEEQVTKEILNDNSEQTKECFPQQSQPRENPLNVIPTEQPKPTRQKTRSLPKKGKRQARPWSRERNSWRSTMTT